MKRKLVKQLLSVKPSLSRDEQQFLDKLKQSGVTRVVAGKGHLKLNTRQAAGTQAFKEKAKNARKIVDSFKGVKEA